MIDRCRFWVNNVRLQSQNQPKNETTKLSVVTPPQASSFFQMIEMTKGIFLNLQGYLGKKFEDFLYVFFLDGNLCFDFIVWILGVPFFGSRPKFRTRPPIDMFTNQASHREKFCQWLLTQEKTKVCCCGFVMFVSKQKEIDKKKSFNHLNSQTTV